MLVRNASNRLQLHYDQILNNQIGKILTKTKSITIIDAQRLLGLNTETFLLKAMHQSIFINLFQQASAKINMQIVGDLPNPCHEPFNIRVFHF